MSAAPARSRSRFTPQELAKQMQKLALDPKALVNAARRSRSVGRPDAAARPRRPRRKHRPQAADGSHSRRKSGAETVEGRIRMKGVATDIGTIHFVGIGGIGMSGIAEVMHNLGYKVQGRTSPRAMSSRGCAGASR
jgi:hypothetical protein